MFGALRKNRQGSRVGIDISSTTVKLLELSESNGGYRVEAYSVASLPQGAVFEKNINNVGEVATAISPRCCSIKLEWLLIEGQHAHFFGRPPRGW